MIGRRSISSGNLNTTKYLYVPLINLGPLPGAERIYSSVHLQNITMVTTRQYVMYINTIV